MSKVPIKDAAASIRDRLLMYAKAHGDNFQRVLVRYAVERLLFRLAQTDIRDTYILKGAMLFITWPEHAFRPTGDLDLLGHGDPSPEALTAIFAEICAVDCPEDGIFFDPSTLRIEATREDEQYRGVKVKLNAKLAKAVIPVQVDVGFGDRVYPAASRRNFPGLIEGLPSADMLMYPPETVVAEKFEAMIRFGEANGRIKDFHDIWVAAHTFDFRSDALAEAIRGTLERRGTTIPADLPEVLDAPFADLPKTKELWAGFLRRTNPGYSRGNFGDVVADLRLFLGPLLPSLTDQAAPGQVWSAAGRKWQ